jgi:cysteine desulfurase
MLPYLEDKWGNPSSLHADGTTALEGVERAREHVALLLGAEPDEIIFTGSGTEADNHALVGVSLANRERGNHIITSAIEHHAVLDTAEFLARHDTRGTYLPVDSAGVVDPDAVRGAITDDTILVSIMHANNEVGTIQPIAEIGALCREREVLFHTDAVQTAGHIPIDVREMNIDLLSLSAHKLYGPKGIGALFLRKGVRLAPFIHGGGQERDRRASTENVPGIVGLGEAARLARKELRWEMAHSIHLRDRLIAGVLGRVSDAMLTGHPQERLPNNASFCVRDVEGESLLLNLDLEGISVSSGSACTSGSLRPSHVLLAMGIPEDVARGSLRVTVGRTNSALEGDRFLDALPPIVDRLRQMAPAPRAEGRADAAARGRS